MRLAWSIGFVGLVASAHAQPAPQCPDSSETRRTLAWAVDQAYKGFVRNPAAAVPPVCLYARIASEPQAHSDSTVLQALALSSEALKRAPDDPANLSARIVLLARMRRYAEVQPTFDNLFVADGSRLTLPLYRLAIAAAIHTNDTLAMDKYLGGAATKFPAETQIAAELRVLRQVARLRALVDTVHRKMKRDPTLIEGFATLASIYGNLREADSALKYTRLALSRGVSRAVVAPALESLIGAEMRHAQLGGGIDIWEATLPVAKRIDSTLSTAATKYLIALTLSELVTDGARVAQTYMYGVIRDSVTGLSLATVSPDGRTYARVLTCEKLVELNAQMEAARALLAAGGDQFAPQTVPTIRNGLSRMKAIIAMLEPRCRPG